MLVNFGPHLVVRLRKLSMHDRILIERNLTFYNFITFSNHLVSHVFHPIRAVMDSGYGVCEHSEESIRPEHRVYGLQCSINIIEPVKCLTDCEQVNRFQLVVFQEFWKVLHVQLFELKVHNVLMALCSLLQLGLTQVSTNHSCENLTHVLCKKSSPCSKIHAKLPLHR